MIRASGNSEGRRRHEFKIVFLFYLLYFILFGEFETWNCSYDVGKGSMEVRNWRCDWASSDVVNILYNATYMHDKRSLLLLETIAGVDDYSWYLC